MKDVKTEPVRIPISNDGELIKHGYHNVKHLKADDRHVALEKAVKEYGAVTVMRKLNALYILTRNNHKTVSEIFRRDRNWIGRTYLDKDYARDAKKAGAGMVPSPTRGRKRGWKMMGGCGCGAAF